MRRDAVPPHTPPCQRASPLETQSAFCKFLSLLVLASANFFEIDESQTPSSFDEGGTGAYQRGSNYVAMRNSLSPITLKLSPSAY